VELQSRYADITRQGLGLIAISYDSPETLRKFSDSRGITFPLISDPGSAIIRKYGLLNNTVDPKSRTYGIPHPGTFVLDRKGVVQSRFFEDAYQERYTAATILSTFGAGAGGGAISADTRHLTMIATISDASAVAANSNIFFIFIFIGEEGKFLRTPQLNEVLPLTLEEWSSMGRCP
jgi:hypothetical protein